MRFVSIGAPVILVLLASATVAIDLKRTQQHRLYSDFDALTHRSFSTIKSRIQTDVNRLQSLADYLSLHSDVRHAEFESLASAQLNGSIGLQSLAWIPRTSPDQPQNQSHDTFSIRFQVPSEASQTNTQSLDQVVTNLASTPEILTAWNAARDTGAMTAIPEARTESQSFGKASASLVIPVYQKGTSTATLDDRRKHLTGFAIGSFSVENIVRSLSDDQLIDDIAVSITGKDPPPEQSARLPPKSYQYEIGGHEWEFVFSPTPEYLDERTHWHSRLIFPAGMLISVLLGLVLYSTSQDAARYEDAMNQRTFELDYERYLLNTLVENMPDPIFFKDSDGRFIRVNRAMAKDAGFDDPEELIGKTDRDIWSGDLPESTSNDERHILETGEPIVNKVEQPITHDGPPRWVLVTKLPLRDAADEIVGTFGIAREFTERKKMEDELQSLNDELSIVNGALETINRELAHRAEEAEAAQARAEKAEVQLESVVKNLEETADRYHKLVDNLPVCATRKDQDGRVTFVNRAFCEFVATDANEIIGKTDRDLFPQELAEKYIADDRHVMETRTILECRETNIKDGETRDVHVVKAPWFDDSGTTQGVLVVFWDVTKQVRYEKQLQDIASQLQSKTNELSEVNNALKQSNEDLQQFAYVASHDLQTPLRGIAGFAQFLAQDYQGQLDSQADDYIRRIVDGCKRMQRLINDLLSYSRVESRAAPLEPVNLNEIVDDVKALLRATVEEKDAVITREDLPTIAADRAQLSQLFQNLVGNALKYQADTQPEIHISATSDDDRCTVSVQDNGIGIAEEHRDRIFDIFRRLHTEKTYPGTGIGLAVCKRIVSRHKGHIWVESNSKQGCTFHFTIPISTSEDNS